MSWENAQTFSDLLNLNSDFLSRKIPIGPLNIGPLDEDESEIPSSLIPSVRRLHDLQIITYDCQIGECVIGPNGEGKFYENRQRPSICFLTLEKHNTLNLFAKLSALQGVVVCAAKLLPFEDVAGSYDSYPVTQIRVSESEEELSTLQCDGTYKMLFNIEGSFVDCTNRRF